MLFYLRTPFKYKIVTIELEQILLNVSLLSLQLDSKSKSWSFAQFRIECYFTIKLLNNLIRQHQPQPNSLWINLVFLLKSKQFFKLFMIFFINSNACINHWNFKVLAIYFGNNFDFSSLGVLQGVRLQVKEDLHDSLLIAVD